MEIEEKIKNVQKEIGKLVFKKMELDDAVKELTDKIEEKRKELFELELEKNKRIMESRKNL